MGKEYTRSAIILGQLPIAGQIVGHDDFESILHWTKMDGEGDSIFELNPTLAKHGSQSLYMKTRTTNAAENDTISARRILHLLPSKVMSIFSSIYFHNYPTTKTYSIHFRWLDAYTIHLAEIRFEPNTGKWEYFNSIGAYTEIPNFTLKLSGAAWHLLNLKVNFATGYYLSFQVDHLIADLRSYPFRIDGISPNTSLHLKHTITTIGAAPTDLSIDDVIIHEL